MENPVKTRSDEKQIGMPKTKMPFLDFFIVLQNYYLLSSAISELSHSWWFCVGGDPLSKQKIFNDT